MHRKKIYPKSNLKSLHKNHQFNLQQKSPADDGGNRVEEDEVEERPNDPEPETKSIHTEDLHLDSTNENS
jgi:hypothetical protein